jgi:hypothetical protein
VSFVLQTVPPVIVVDQSSTGTVELNLTNLKGTNSAELTYFGAPSGVTLAFATNPDTSSSVVTVTVGATVAPGRYTITVVGTATTPNIEYVQLNLVVPGAGSAPPPPAGPAVVSLAIAAGSVNPGTTTVGSINTTGATFLLATVYSNSAANLAPSEYIFTDTYNNTWTPVTNQGTAGAPSLRTFYAATPTVGTGHSLSLQLNGDSGGRAIVAFSSWTGLSASPFEVENDSASPLKTPPFQGGSVAATTAGDLLITAICGYDGFSEVTGLPATVNDGYTILDSLFDATTSGAAGIGAAAIAYLVAPNTSAVNPTWTLQAACTNAYIQNVAFAA